VRNCPYCSTLIDETYNFCIDCEQPVKCIACNEYLIKDKSKCLKCGTSLKISQVITTPINKFSLEEKQSGNNYSRKLDLFCTDNAIDKIAPFIVSNVPFTIPKNNPKQSLNAEPHIASRPLLQASSENAQLEQSEIINDEDEIITEKNVLNSSNNSPSHYFEKDGRGLLISTTHDYKGKNKKIQQQRFSILYVWAYYSLNGNPVLREHLIQAAKENGVYDKNNYLTYLKDVSGRFFTKLDDAFKLNPSGSAEVKLIQTEMQDSEVSGFEYWNPTRRKSNGNTRAKKEDLERAEDWLQIQSRFDNFDIRSLSTRYELAIFALYDITKELKVENAVKSSLVYEYLTRRYETVSATQKNISDTLSDKSNKKYFDRTSEGLYFLTQEAENIGRNWMDSVVVEN
jgi:hypothetical protein